MSDKVRSQLVNTLPAKHVDSLLKHFTKMTGDFQASDWEGSTAKGGKFVEASLKAMCDVANVPYGSGRAFKAGSCIDKLAALPNGSCHDSIRLLLPRAARLVYEIASNRGARHDPDEVDSNKSDAGVVMAVCSWMCGEMIRVSSSGAVDQDEAQKLVDGLSERSYPTIEEIDGKLWFHGKRVVHRDVALVLLHRTHPTQMPRSDLLDALRRHGASKRKAQNLLSNLKRDRLVHEGTDGFFLLAPGRLRAEEVLRATAELE